MHGSTQHFHYSNVYKLTNAWFGNARIIKSSCSIFELDLKRRRVDVGECFSVGIVARRTLDVGRWRPNTRSLAACSHPYQNRTGCVLAGGGRYVKNCSGEIDNVGAGAAAALAESQPKAETLWFSGSPASRLARQIGTGLNPHDSLCLPVATRSAHGGHRHETTTPNTTITTNNSFTPFYQSSTIFDSYDVWICCLFLAFARRFFQIVTLNSNYNKL